METVFGWAADVNGCGYYRMELPFRLLRERHGIDAVTSTTLPPDLSVAGHVFVGQRVCNPGPTITWQRLKGAGARLVFEIDDDLWRIHPTNKSAYKFFQGDALDRLTGNLRLADAVTVTTQPLARFVSRWNDNVHVLPNCIDAGLLKHRRTRRSKVTIGWAGSSTHLADLRPIAPLLRVFLSTTPIVSMHFIGTDYSGLVGQPCRFTKWFPDVPTYQHNIDFDIGLAPLAPIRFNLSKSPIKALEYAALGIPVIASNYGPYADFVRHGETGFLANTAEDWTKYLRELTHDADLRKAMGEAARAQAAEHTIQGNAHRWLDVYREVGR